MLNSLSSSQRVNSYGHLPVTCNLRETADLILVECWLYWKDIILKIILSLTLKERVSMIFFFSRESYSIHTTVQGLTSQVNLSKLLNLPVSHFPPL